MSRARALLACSATQAPSERPRFKSGAPDRFAVKENTIDGSNLVMNYGSKRYIDWILVVPSPARVVVVLMFSARRILLTGNP